MKLRLCNDSVNLKEVKNDMWNIKTRFKVYLGNRKNMKRVGPEVRNEIDKIRIIFRNSELISARIG